MIEVTKPYLPPYEEYAAYLKDIWARNWLTNNGPLVNELELRLKQFLGIDHLLFVTNGTIALQIAIKALGLTGEIITTPFSYVATTSSIAWENCEPVFVDVERSSLNINPLAIEDAITDKTSAILATHTYGNPCNVDLIEAIAKKHSLKVIYDAAHCFGTTYKGKSIFHYGDISTVSFHATKPFHTIEGGAVFTSDPELLKKMAFMRNFGHDGPLHFAEIGINAKNSEVHAAMGLVNLNHFQEISGKRKSLADRYDFWMKTIKAEKPEINPSATINHSYYPVIFPNEEILLKTLELLNTNLIYPRRYFFPSLNTLPYVTNKDLPVCMEISKRVLCLPLHPLLSTEEVDLICRLILRGQNY